MKQLLIPFVLLACTVSMAALPIPGNDKRIRVLGTRYSQPTETGLRFQRHREDVLAGPRKELGINPDKARNASGIVLAFETDSKTVAARFKVHQVNYMGSAFGTFVDGRLVDEQHYAPKVKDIAFELKIGSPGRSLVEIALPSFADVEFLGLELDEGSTLSKPAASRKPVYVALGDSISHGVGQEGATHKTWPFLLSRHLKAEVFNLAVGGGKVSVPIAEMLSDWEQIDVITILIGYNDLHFDGKTPEIYRSKYNELLDTIRQHHPRTKIYCITPLYTKKPVSEKTGHRIGEFRSVLKALIEKRIQSDGGLFLVDGAAMTSEQSLRPDHPQDPVHLGVEGAAMLAEKLGQLIQL